MGPRRQAGPRPAARTAPVAVAAAPGPEPPPGAAGRRRDGWLTVGALNGTPLAVPVVAGTGGAG